MEMDIENQQIIKRHNNFDLIRILAALQVVFIHYSYHLEIKGFKVISDILEYIPGVPIFFAMSGYLIYASYERNSKSNRNFFLNRFYRLFPGLWVSVMVCVLLLIATSSIPLKSFLSGKFVLWIIGQTTFFQFWTPDFLRIWGVGTPNGSLWTIVVEMQFYFLVPILYLLLNRYKKKEIWILSGLIISSFLFNHFSAPYLKTSSILSKLIHVSIFPYLYYFIFGIIVYIYRNVIKNYINNRFFAWIAIYILFCIIFSGYFKLFGPGYYPTIVGFFSQILLIGAIFSFAFSFNGLSSKLLKGIDISYGIYIYHMLALNTIISLSFKGYEGFLIALIVTLTMAIISWFFVESPILNLKKTRQINFIK